MNLRNGGCAFSDSCSYALYRPLANVTDSEDAAAARLQRQLRCLAGQDETFVIQRDAAVEPLGVGIGANEEEHMLRIDLPALTCLLTRHKNTLQVAIGCARQPRHGGMHAQLNIGRRGNPVDQIARHRGFQPGRTDHKVYATSVEG